MFGYHLTLTRRELYELSWAKPLIGLARNFGIITLRLQ